MHAGGTVTVPVTCIKDHHWEANTVKAEYQWGKSDCLEEVRTPRKGKGNSAA